MGRSARSRSPKKRDKHMLIDLEAPRSRSDRKTKTIVESPSSLKAATTTAIDGEMRDSSRSRSSRRQKKKTYQNTHETRGVSKPRHGTRHNKSYQNTQEEDEKKSLSRTCRSPREEKSHQTTREEDDEQFGSIREGGSLVNIPERRSTPWQERNELTNAGSEAGALKLAKLRVDEAFLEYTRWENAALTLQQSFRSNRSDQSKSQRKDSSHFSGDDDEDDNDSKDLKKDLHDDAPADRSDWYLLLLVGCGGIFQILVALAKSCFGNSDVDGVVMDGAMNPALGGNGGGGIGGGGGAAPPPPGLETMAGQAAGAASSSAGAGTSAGAVAGAAATASATSAAAGATAATATTIGATTQVVTVVAVSSAVATVASTSGILTPPSPAEVIFTTCGLVNPQERIGKFTMLFEGFSRTLDGRESNILEGLVLGAYNEITFGSGFNVTGNCSDPLSREMEEVNILEQSFDTLIEGGLDGSLYLKILFETRIVCDSCLASRPLFKNEQEQSLVEEEVQGNRTQVEQPSPNSTRFLRNKLGRLLEDVGQEYQQGQQFQDELQDLAVDELASFDVSGADFFQELIQKVIMETEELSLIGELPTGFVSVAQAYVTPTPKENGVDAGLGGPDVIGDSEGSPPDDVTELFTKVKFQKQGDKAVFEFTFTDEDTQERVQDTVLVIPSDPNSVPVPTTSLPTFSPTTQPSAIPSVSPTITFSGQPTQTPSRSPSFLPSVAPSEYPSSAPSRMPSESPSALPSALPSGTPTMFPSSVPSMNPSSSPSDDPSVNPSSLPSMVPSFVPSRSPSDVPSVNPSSLPSMVPSFVPSDAPSTNPSSKPSSSPSGLPSALPSIGPTTLPSAVPTRVPTPLPTKAPTPNPTPLPTRPPTPNPTPLPTVFVPPAPPGTVYIGQGRCRASQGIKMDFCVKETGIANAQACYQLCTQYPTALRGFDINYDINRCSCRYENHQTPLQLLSFTPNAFDSCTTTNSGSGPVVTVLATPADRRYCFSI
ncbi:MAG: hypothetical protein SGBAC_013029, partial [Bacillariaceae sp.]